jgi:thiamine pyridinylase
MKTKSHDLILPGLLLLFLALQVTAWAQAFKEPDANCCRTIRVVLYPFLPAHGDYFFQVQHDFEAANPRVKLQILDLSANYYDPKKADYVGASVADVYELDSILLADFISQNRIQPLPQKIPIRSQDYLKNAQSAATWGTVWYGVPHWVCGYFLFFRSDDPNADKLRNVKDLAGLEKIVGANHQVGEGVLVDMMGKLSLGEMYLAAAFDRYSDWDHVLPHLQPDQNPEEEIESDLWRLSRLSDTNFGRSSRYHYADGFYGRQFAHGHGRLLVGYSEGLSPLLDEEKNACQSNECMNSAMIDVAALPLDDHALHPISWVDLLTIDKNCTGDKLNDAIAFIDFINREDEMLKALMPDNNTSRSARYLLPAKASLYANTNLLNAAPLYPKLRGIIEDSFPPVGTNMNATLRIYGATVDSFLSATNKSPRP